MPMESACQLQVGRDAFEGRAQLEGDYIDFKGVTKHRFRIAEIRDPRRDDHKIIFNFHGNTVTMALDGVRTAETWIEYVLHPQTLADKLGVRKGHTVRIMNIDDHDLIDSLQSRNARLASRSNARCDIVMLGVERPSELRQLEDLSENLRPKGAIWVVLPKTGRTVTKANVFAAAREAGLNHVEVIDFSETQSAHKITRRATPRRRGGSDGNGENGSSSGKRPPARRSPVKARS